MIPDRASRAPQTGLPTTAETIAITNAPATVWLIPCRTASPLIMWTSGSTSIRTCDPPNIMKLNRSPPAALKRAPGP